MPAFKCHHKQSIKTYTCIYWLFSLLIVRSWLCSVFFNTCNLLGVVIVGVTGEWLVIVVHIGGQKPKGERSMSANSFVSLNFNVFVWLLQRGRIWVKWTGNVCDERNPSIFNSMCLCMTHCVYVSVCTASCLCSVCLSIELKSCVFTTGFPRRRGNNN